MTSKYWRETSIRLVAFALYVPVCMVITMVAVSALAFRGNPFIELVILSGIFAWPIVLDNGVSNPYAAAALVEAALLATVTPSAIGRARGRFA